MRVERGSLGYEDTSTSSAHAYLLPAVRRHLARSAARSGCRRVFDLGCGNGSVAAAFSAEGYHVQGVDPSAEGIARANRRWPDLELSVGDCYEDLAGRFGTFPTVLSLEVVEHVYSPRRYAATLRALVGDRGTAIVSTPYHGYWKNLALAVTGRFDRHFTALWEGGHIKFWSIATLRALLLDAGFTEVSFERVGRIPPLAKAMIAVARA